MFIVDSASPVLLDLRTSIAPGGRFMRIAGIQVICLDDFMYMRVKVCVTKRFVGVGVSYQDWPRLLVGSRVNLGCNEIV